MAKKAKHTPASFRLPNHILDNPNLSISAKELAITLYRLIGTGCNQYHTTPNTLCIDQRRLAHISGLDRGTVKRAAEELAKAGYIGINHRGAHWDSEKERYTRRRNLYFVQIPNKDYTLVPFGMIQKVRGLCIRGAACLVLLFIHRMLLMPKSRSKGRCWPSISYIATRTFLANSTVRAALRVLERANIILKQSCKKLNGAFTSNSYFPLTVVKQMQLVGYTEISANSKKLKITEFLTRGRGTILGQLLSEVSL